MTEMLGFMLVVLASQVLMVSALIVGSTVEKRRKSNREVSRYE
jgi:NADH:ubiquinone oxidoreductase subunit 3 (subunit A)